jgi:cob(I)alamin adenosyltransferase
MSAWEKGYVHIYTGEGKGKTTAAIGLAVRAAGHGMKTYMGQFMKGQVYGELMALKDAPWISIEQYGDTLCIHKEEVTGNHRDQAARGLSRTREMMRSGRFDILILDEVLVAVWFTLLTEQALLEVLKERPESMEIILTGRRATPALIQAADLVSDIREVKHYYQRGVLARDGIER